MAKKLSFDPYLGWVNITNPDQIPADARVIGADDLLRYENFGKDATSAINEMAAFATDEGLASLASNPESTFSGLLTDFFATKPWRKTLAALNNLKGDYTGRFGAPGTGTDDRPALQAMINAGSQRDGNYQYSEIKRRGVTVTIPAGIYILTAPANGQPSLTIPEGVTADFSRAMLFFDYPAAATGSWCGILLQNGGSLILPSMMGPSGRNVAPGAPGESTTDRLYDGVRILGANNTTSTVRAHTVSEIRGFKGASIRGIGSWVTRIEGPIKFSSDLGYIASNWPADNIYGYAHTSALTGIISGVRLHTDVYISGPAFYDHRYGGYLGVVTGDPVTPHALDYTRSGGHQAYLTETIFENFAHWAIRCTGSVFSMLNGAFEEVGSPNNAIAHLDNIRSVTIKNLRVNLAGRTVPSSTGNMIPGIPVVWRVNSVSSLTSEAGYIHNSYNNSLQLFNAAASTYDVIAPNVDANPLSNGPMYTPRARAVSSGYMLAARHGNTWMWATDAGVWRTKFGSAPTSDTDGVVLGSQA